MKILYIWDADYPWDVRVEKICSTLARHGHKVHIAARNLKRFQENEIIGDLMIHRLKAWQNEHINYFLTFPAFFNPVWRRFLDEIIRDNSIDTIIVRDLPMAIAGIWAGKRHKVPVIFDMAEDYVAMLRDIWKARKYQGLNFLVRNPYLAKYVERYVFREAGHIFVVVDEAKDLVIRRGAYPQKVTIVGNTPPLEAFLKGEAKENEILQKIKNRYSIIYTGGIQMGRGIQVVLDAIPEIIKEIPNLLFVIVGDGYATPKLKEMIKAKNVQDYVLWVGWVDHKEIFDYIRASRVGVIPHLVTDHVNTTIPNKIFDYMGLGLPVIASDAAPIKRILDNERCGMIYRSGNPRDFVDKLLKISISPSCYGENGRNAVETRYNWNEDTKRLLSVIERFTLTTENY